MRRITLVERQKVLIGDATSGITAADADTIARALPNWPAGTVKWEYQSLRVGKICGVVQAGDITIEILPKISQDRKAVDARGILVSMLRTANELLPRRLGSGGVAVQQLHLLDIFILDFCERVNELLRRGPIRSYQTREEYLGVVRGRLLISELATSKSFDRTQIPCRYDELSEDNPHNRALKYALRQFLRIALGQRAKTATNTLLRRMEEVTTQVVSSEHFEHLKFDRLTRPWEAVFNRAKLLLRTFFPDVKAGETEGMCLLFDMEILFQSFVGSCVRRLWRSSAARVITQGPVRYFANSATGPAFRLIPDITVESEIGRTERIMDAKWKSLDPSKFDMGVDERDIYQIAAYASRNKCSSLALLYPANERTAPGLVKVFSLNDRQGSYLSIYALDIAALAVGASLPQGLGPTVLDGIYTPVAA